MRKLLFLLLGALGAALPAGAENKIQMVTYFPVPYVAYSQITPSKQLDIGMSSACTLNLGCADSKDAGLNSLYVTSALNLKKGRLDLNSAAAVYSTLIRMGNGYGLANFDFSDNLRIRTLNNGYTIETDQATVNTLNLFPSRIKNAFPSCASVSGTDSISWQRLQLNAKEETYLMCGNPSTVEVEQEPCTAGRTRVNNYYAGVDTCNGDTKNMYTSAQFTVTKKECYDVYRICMGSSGGSSGGCPPNEPTCPVHQIRQCVNGVWKCVTPVNGDNGVYNPNPDISQGEFENCLQVTDLVVTCPSATVKPLG